MTPPPQAVLKLCSDYGIVFDEGDLDVLGDYLNLLLETNKSFNLTAITDPDEAWMRHIFDSLTLLPYIVEAGAQRIIDIGSGGGVPGVPLAIALRRKDARLPAGHEEPPTTQDAARTTQDAPRFTLLESTGKKAAFLRNVITHLGLTNVEIINDRAEMTAHDSQHREQYDIVTARAVGPLNVLLELTVPLARVGGLVLAIKGEKAPEEVEQAKSALHKLHATVIDRQRTPTGTIIAIEKRRTTPKIYPRRPGEPKRSPL